jgi:hypothetical protein
VSIKTRIRPTTTSTPPLGLKKGNNGLIFSKFEQQMILFVPFLWFWCLGMLFIVPGISFADRTYGDYAFQDAFIIAATYGDMDRMTLLLDLYGINYIDHIIITRDDDDEDGNKKKKDISNNGVTALMAASEANQMSVIQLLLDRGANVDYPAHDGMTALSMPQLLVIRTLFNNY